MLLLLAAIATPSFAFTVEASPESVPAALLHEAVLLRCAEVVSDGRVWLSAPDAHTLAIVVESPGTSASSELPIDGLAEPDRVRAAALLVCETAEHAQAKLTPAAEAVYTRAVRPWLGVSLSTGSPELGVGYHAPLQGGTFEVMGSLRNNASLLRVEDPTNASPTITVAHQVGLTARAGWGRHVGAGGAGGADVGSELARNSGGPLFFVAGWVERPWRAWVPRLTVEVAQASILDVLLDGTQTHARGFRSGFVASIAWRGAA